MNLGYESKPDEQMCFTHIGNELKPLMKRHLLRGSEITSSHRRGFEVWVMSRVE